MIYIIPNANLIFIDWTIKQNRIVLNLVRKMFQVFSHRVVGF